MERTTALSTAGAFTLTAAAAVSALFLTMDRGAQAADATDPAVMEPEVVTEYEVVQLQPEAAAGVSEPSADDVGEIVYETEYVYADGSAASAPADEYPEDEAEEGEYPEDDEEEDDD